MPSPARTRFYIDADILGLAGVLMSIRTDVTYPGDPGGVGLDNRHRSPCPITTPATDDDDWIPIVTELGYIVITKDSAIGRTPRLRTLVVQHGARLVAIAARGKMRTWDHLVVLTSVWDKIEALETVPGPWMYRANRGGLTPVDLSGPG